MKKPFSRIHGQEQAKAVLSAAVAAGRLAHAYILAGPDGSGRLTAALDLARVLICGEEGPGFCGECRHCRQIDDLSHPDVRFTIPMLKTTGPGEVAELLTSRAADGVTPLRFSGNTYISIEQIREIEGRLSKKSFEGRGYVEIMTDAHLMRREAANAMLKTLEEPPPHTLIILVTSSLSGLLPTVRSRAHTVRFGRLPKRTVEEVLKERGIPEARAHRLSLLSDGCPGRALLLADADLEESPMARELLEAAVSGIPPMEAAILAGDIAGKLGREGIMELCAEIVSLAHDSRRAAVGAVPLERENIASLGDADDSMLQAVVDGMRLCQTRIRANVSPPMALAAALGAAAEIASTL